MMNTFKKITGLLLLIPAIVYTVFLLIDLILSLVGADLLFRTGDNLGPLGTAGIAGALLLFNTKNTEK